MIRIKDLDIPQLNDYLQAYTNLYALEPENEEVEFKIRAITKALEDRELLGIETKPDRTSFIQRNILNKLKK